MNPAIVDSDLETVFTALGWTATKPRDLAQPSIDAFAARNLVQYTTNSRVSPRWKQQWDVVKKNAAGVVNKVAIEDAISMQHFFVGYDAQSLLIVNDLRGNTRQVSCEMVVSSNFDTDFTQAVGDPSRFPNPVQSLKTQSQGNGFLQITTYDSNRIEPAIDAEFPFIAYVNMVPQ